MQKLKLYPHQLDALKKTENLNKVAYYLDMGLGKTYIGAEKAVSFPEKILVVCQKSKIQDWLEHFRTYYDLKVFDLTNKNQFENFQSDGSKCVGIVNYDLIFRREFFLTMENFTLMLDESSLIQNSNSKRTRTILKMQPKNVILLSGTPTAGKYEKLWSQLRLLGWEISKGKFYQTYVVLDFLEVRWCRFKIPIVIGYKNIEDLKQKFDEYGAIFMKSDEAFELPKQNLIPVYSKTPKNYWKFLMSGKITIGEREISAKNPLSKRIYARMICSFLNAERIATMKDLVESTEDRLVIFYNFNEELAVMREAISDLKRPISIVNGSVKDLKAYEKHDNSITFVQYQAGSKGLNLQKANKIIYFSLTEKCDDWMQSMKRIHRIGQEKPCFYYVLLCRGTVEEKILQALQRGTNYTDKLFEKDISEKLKIAC